MGIDVMINIEQFKKRIQTICQDLSLQRLDLVGSVVRDDFTEDSDIDVLVSFDPERIVTLLDLVGLNDFLTETLGRKVDVAIKKSLKPFIGKQILSEVEYV